MAISLYELAQRVNSAMPLGTIVPYYGTDEPSGWKICDGRSCAGTDLEKKLGISVVPDLRGRFIRMIGGNAGEMGVAQEDCIRNITGSYQQIIATLAYIVSTTGTFNVKSSGRHGYYSNNDGNNQAAMVTFDASRVVPTGPENRPVNMAFNYIIKVNTNVILYYVSNIIYKAKAHICRTFSFVKSFQREVRNSMSISLNNHESRLSALEKIKTEGIYKSDILWNGNKSGTGIITLSHPMSEYDMILTYSHNITWPFCNIYDVKNWIQDANKCLPIGHTPSQYYIGIDPTTVSSTSVKISRSESTLVRIIGIKFTKVI